MKVVIVGGVAAGASTGARVRRLDDSAEIVILERGRYVSFANCGLPYHIGGEIPDRNSLLLQTPESLAASLALDVRTGHEVVGIDPAAKEVEVHEIEGGRTYREAVRQAGAVPRGRAHPTTRSPGPTSHGSMYCATSPTWIASSTNSIPSATRAVVIGGSYIGLEMAEAFRSRGLGNRDRRADRPSDAVAGPGDDQDPRLPRHDPRRRYPSRQFGQGDP